MAKRKRQALTDEFKAETVQLVRDSGKSIGVVTQELNLSRIGASASRFRRFTPRAASAIAARGCTPSYGSLHVDLIAAIR